MSWSRYDDEMPSNRKVAWLRAHGVNGIAALGLHMLANCWSRHEGMQGFIPDYMPEQLVGRPHAKLAALLVEIDMFLVVEHGWFINDYDEYGDRDDGTPVAEKLARISKVRAEAGRRGGLAKAAKRPSNRPSNGAGLPVANGQQTSSPVPVPVPSNSTNAHWSRNEMAQAGSTVPAAAVRAYVGACAEPPAKALQARIEKQARTLVGEGHHPDRITAAAANAGRAGWTDLAVQMQRDAARASPQHGTSTTDQRTRSALDLADRLDRKALE